MKLGQLILRKIIKIVVIRRQILKLKCTKIDFDWGSAQTLMGTLTAFPRPLGWNKGDLLLREGEGYR